MGREMAEPQPASMTKNAMFAVETGASVPESAMMCEQHINPRTAIYLKSYFLMNLASVLFQAPN